MASILDCEFCNKCKTFNLVEEYHIWGVSMYCTNCDYTYEYVVEDDDCNLEESK